MIRLWLLTNLLVLRVPAVGDALMLPAVDHALLLSAVGIAVSSFSSFLLCSLGFGPLSLLTHRLSPFFGFMLCSAIWCCLFR